MCVCTQPCDYTKNSLHLFLRRSVVELTLGIRTEICENNEQNGKTRYAEVDGIEELRLCVCVCVCAVFGGRIIAQV